MTRHIVVVAALSFVAIKPAFAEMTSEDVKSYIAQILTERRIDFDRRIDSIEKANSVAAKTLQELLEERTKYQDAQLQAIKINIDDNVKFFSKQVENINATILAYNASQKEATNYAFASAKEAVDKASIANEKRFDSVNEFRAQLKDQQTLLMPRAEAEGKIKANQDALTLLQQRLDVIVGRGEGANTVWMVLSAILGLVIGAGSVAAGFIRKQTPHDHDTMIERLANETELNRIRTAMSAEASKLESRINRLEAQRVA